MEIQSKREIKSLTGIRGLAALLVAMHHFYWYFYQHGSKSSILSTGYFRVFFYHGYLAVDMFFILSAFVITLSSAKLFDGEFKLKSYRLFMLKRWIRIYPAYLIVLLFGYVLLLNFHFTANFLLSLTLLNILFNCTYLFDHLWSLGAEWVTYLLYPLIFKYAHISRGKIWSGLVLASGFIILIAVGFRLNRHTGYYVDLNIFGGYRALFRCLGDYLIGMTTFYIYKNLNIKLLTNHIAAVVIVLLAVACLGIRHIDIAAIFIFMLLIVSVSKDCNIVAWFLSSKPIYFLGLISYPLYLVHFLIFQKMNVIHPFLMSHFSFGRSYYTLFVVYMTASIGIAAVFTYLIERPAIKMLNKLLIHKPNGKAGAL